MTAGLNGDANPTPDAEGPGNADTDATTRNASVQESSVETRCANAGPTTAPTPPIPAHPGPPSPTTTRSAAANWLRQAWTQMIRLMDEDSASPATTGTLHALSLVDGTRQADNNPPPAPRHRRAKASHTPRTALYAILSAFQARGRHILRVRDERQSAVQERLTADLQTDRAWGPLTPWPYVVVDPRTAIARHRRNLSANGAPPVPLPLPSPPRAGAAGQGDAHQPSTTNTTEGQQ